MRANLPRSPGCYIYKDKSGKVIYVGKAKNLKKRVDTYFQKKDLDPKTSLLVKNIDKIDFIVTDNEIEALILENNLIKKHSPHYNINLKDSRRYAYIQITDEDFPRLVIARIHDGKGSYFGPFVSGIERNYLLSLLKKTFCLRTCKRMPKRPCLRHHIGLCDAPCIGGINKADYKERMEKIECILNGNHKELISTIKQEIKVLSKEQKFEKAIHLREQLAAVRALSDKQKMERSISYDEDIIDFRIKERKVYLLLFNIHKGMLENKQEFIFDFSDYFLEQFLMQYYSDTEVPKEIILSRSIDSQISNHLEQKRGKKLHITIPKKGIKKQLIDLVQRNIDVTFFRGLKQLEEMQEKLQLQDTPSVIECFDVSHLSGTSTVASMVQFRNGEPDKSNYRRFRIRTVEGIDDTASIAEVVKRRYHRLKNEAAELPDLVIIDGGRGQLTSAINELRELGLRIPIISIAKKFEEIHIPGLRNPIKLGRKDIALQMVQRIRDEAHRFAIQYNKLLRSKEMKK